MPVYYELGIVTGLDLVLPGLLEVRVAFWLVLQRIFGQKGQGAQSEFLKRKCKCERVCRQMKHQHAPQVRSQTNFLVKITVGDMYVCILPSGVVRRNR